MALANIIREPRRELTETGIGLLVTAVVIAVLYLPSHYLGSWFQETGARSMGFTTDMIWLWTSIAMVLCFFGGWIFWGIVHNVGEAFCDNLAQRGIEMRGERRRRR